ncbi:MAG: methionine adenosyltransferase [Acidimicrobiia bacterium]|nr:methionine adenosyltransferase [Acidimicrobiia bacterium]
MKLSITTRSPYAPSVEFVERKGTGHPDTICDHLAEQLARELASQYLEHTGVVQHFNVDKAILAAGSVEVEYGGGEHTRPSRLVLVGKADSLQEWRPDPEELAVRYKDKLLELLPDATPEAFQVEVWLNQSSTDLATVVNRRDDDVPLANDTSFAAVSSPRSAVEQTVYTVERRLNSDEFRGLHPVGRDIKVMGARVDGAAHVTVACPVLARKVHNRDAYDSVIAVVRQEVAKIATGYLGKAVVVKVNQADQEDSPYLTLTGTSAEAGDDGQVGRGNRFGGLITPYRPMSLEAAAGKNPFAHVGKTYHAVAADIASRLSAETGITESTIRMLSSIGRSVADPETVHIEKVGDADPAVIEQITTECLADWRGVRDRLIDGFYELY